MTEAHIALISAVQAAIPPAEEAFATEFAAARIWNVLDDRLLTEANARGGLDDALVARMRRLIAHAIDAGADAVLLTCSLYGPVAQEMTSARLPVLGPDEAVFAQLARDGYSRVLVVASFDAAADDSARRLRAALADAGASTIVGSIAVADAKSAAEAADKVALERALINHLVSTAPDFDAVFLAQYSLAPAGPTLSAALGLPVFSGPVGAARHLAQVLGGPTRPGASNPRPSHAPGRPRVRLSLADNVSAVDALATPRPPKIGG